MLATTMFRPEEAKELEVLLSFRFQFSGPPAAAASVTAVGYSYSLRRALPVQYEFSVMYSRVILVLLLLRLLYCDLWQAPKYQQ